MTERMEMPRLALDGDVTIPQLGLGMWQVPARRAPDVVSRGLEVGYRHIDTAKLYGNEDGVGAAVRESDVPRDEVFVTTKLWNDEHGYDRARRGFEASLRRLGLEYVDLYLIHWPVPEQDRYVDTWRALQQIRADGLARAVGVSNFSSEQLRRLADETGEVPPINQVELHPTMPQSRLRSAHAEMGVVTEAWAPLGRSRDLRHRTVRDVARRVERTPAQVVLRWHLQLGNVAIPKSANPARMAENIDVLDFQLDQVGMDRLSDLG